jgi:hypothetical protein
VHYPTPQSGDTALFKIEKTQKVYSGIIEITDDSLSRVILFFNEPKIGLKNEMVAFPYKRYMLLGEGGEIDRKRIAMWYDIDNFKLGRRSSGMEILNVGDIWYDKQLMQEFLVRDVIGNIFFACNETICFPIPQPL